jgi:DNA modification methylase
MELNKVYLGDCLDIMQSIPDRSINLILCDLPYGTTGSSWDSIIPLDKLWEQYERIIKDNGSIILTAQGMFCAKLMTYREKWFSHDYVWIKNMHSNFALTGFQPHRYFENVLVFRPPRKDDIEIQFNKELRAYFKKVHEFIGLSKKHIIAVIGQCVDHCFRYTSSQFDLCTKETYDQLIECFKIDQMQGYLNFETLQSMKEELIPYTFNFDDRVKSTKQAKNNDFNRQMYGDKTNQKYKEHISKEYENYPRNTLYFDCERGLHPTQKPVALFEYLIRTYSNEGDVVLDNCAGSGTTAIACMDNNRNYICIEKEEQYYNLINNRIIEHSKQPKLF